MAHFIRPGEAQPTPELVTKAVARAKAGDMSAIHFLYVRFADDVFGYVKSIVHDSHEAEDITQNVFAKLSTKIRKYEPRQVPFTAWILRVAAERGDRQPALTATDSVRRGSHRRRRARPDRVRALAVPARCPLAPPGRAARGSGSTPSGGSHSAGNRSPAREDRGINPRPSPPWPLRASACFARDGRWPGRRKRLALGVSA